MMAPIFPDKDQGTSLVELIIAASILGMIAYFSAQFFNRVSKSEFEARAKTSAISETALFVNTIERDFKLRDITATSTNEAICGSKCKKFSIDRKVRVGASDANMTVRYETVCAAVPAAMRNKFKDPRGNGGNFDFSHAPGAACMSMSGCKANSYPQLVITLNAPSGATLPVYPRQKGNIVRFPDLNDKVSAAASIIGAAICAESKTSGANGSDRITIDTAYITSDGRYAVEKRDVNIPRSNTAKIQMLPSK